MAEPSRRESAETELVRTRGALESLVALLPLALVRVDARGRVITWNRAAEVLFGWSQEEVLGRPLPTVPADDVKSFLENVPDHAQTRSFALRAG